MSLSATQILGRITLSYGKHVVHRSQELARGSVAACRALGRTARAVCRSEAYELRLLVAEAKVVHAATIASTAARAVTTSEPTAAARVA